MSKTYRELGPHEIIDAAQGDEFYVPYQLPGQDWIKTLIPGSRNRTPSNLDLRYRRPITSDGPHYPEWRCSLDPGIPVSVLWAESPANA